MLCLVQSQGEHRQHYCRQPCPLGQVWGLMSAECHVIARKRANSSKTHTYTHTHTHTYWINDWYDFFFFNTAQWEAVGKYCCETSLALPPGNALTWKNFISLAFQLLIFHDTVWELLQYKVNSGGVGIFLPVNEILGRVADFQTFTPWVFELVT